MKKKRDAKKEKENAFSHVFPLAYYHMFYICNVNTPTLVCTHLIHTVVRDWKNSFAHIAMTITNGTMILEGLWRSSTNTVSPFSCNIKSSFAAYECDKAVTSLNAQDDGCLPPWELSLEADKLIHLLQWFAALMLALLCIGDPPSSGLLHLDRMREPLPRIYSLILWLWELGSVSGTLLSTAMECSPSVAWHSSPILKPHFAWQ